MDAKGVISTPRPRRRRLRALLVLTLVTLLAIGLLGLRQYVDAYVVYRGFPPPVGNGAAQGLVRTAQLDSPALGRTASYAVYTPPGYAAAARAGRRFPVLYLLHAPPGSPTGYLTIGALAVRMDELIAAHKIRPFIVVIPDGHTSVDGNDTEWANAGAGRYEQFVLDVVHNVDARYATLPARGDRAIAGLSEGGYGATNIALHHLRDFATFESWSGYFTVDPGPTWNGFSAAQMAANSPRAYVASLAPRLRRLPTSAFLYRGVRDRITSAADMHAFATSFRAAGGHVTTAEYPGTHNWWLWRVHIPQMLRFADAHFTTTAGHPRGALR
jgi:enterochelin esterase-like enzyme